MATPQQPQQQQQDSSSAFPLKEVLLASGVLSVVGMFYFYRKKQTVPFKVCCSLQATHTRSHSTHATYSSDNDKQLPCVVHAHRHVMGSCGRR